MRTLAKIALRYGMIAGVLGAALAIGLYYLGRHPFLIDVLFDFRIVLFAIFLFFLLREFRDFHQGGVLYFWQGIIGSFLFVSLYGTVASLLIGLFTLYEPEFVTSFISLFREQAQRLTEDDIRRLGGKELFERNLEALGSTNGFWMAFNYFKQSYLIGAVLSIIISVILRRQPKT